MRSVTYLRTLCTVLPGSGAEGRRFESCRARSPRATPAYNLLARCGEAGGLMPRKGGAAAIAPLAQPDPEPEHILDQHITW